MDYYDYESKISIFFYAFAYNLATRLMRTGDSG
jgi:hypothetical protein